MAELNPKTDSDKNFCNRNTDQPIWYGKTRVTSYELRVTSYELKV